MGDSTINLAEILEAQRKKADLVPGKQWLQLSNSPLSWLYDLLPERLNCGKNGSPSLLRLRHSELLALTTLIPNVRNNVRKEDFRNRLAFLLETDAAQAIIDRIFRSQICVSC